VKHGIMRGSICRDQAGIGYPKDWETKNGGTDGMDQEGRPLQPRWRKMGGFSPRFSPTGFGRKSTNYYEPFNLRLCPLQTAKSAKAQRGSRATFGDSPATDGQRSLGTQLGRNSSSAVIFQNARKIYNFDGMPEGKMSGPV